MLPLRSVLPKQLLGKRGLPLSHRAAMRSRIARSFQSCTCSVFGAASGKASPTDRCTLKRNQCVPPCAVFIPLSPEGSTIEVLFEGEGFCDGYSASRRAAEEEVRPDYTRQDLTSWLAHRTSNQNQACQ